MYFTATTSCARYFGVRSLQENLARYVRRKMDEQNLSTYDVAKRADGKITHAGVWGILNTQGKDVKVSSIIALASAFKVSPLEVFRAAVRSADEAESVSSIDLLDLDDKQQLLLWMFTDIPEDCQLDTLASMAGVHERRRLSKKIYQRHEARNEAHNIIREKIAEYKASVEENDSSTSSPTGENSAEAA
jgi:hypothetical protein